MSRYLVLVVDDDAPVRFGIRKYLTTLGFDVAEADACEPAVDLYRQQRFDAVIVDHRLPDGNALHLLARFRDLRPGVPVIVLTGHGSIELAVGAMRQGAADFLTKPVELSALHQRLTHLIAEARLRGSGGWRLLEGAGNAVDPFVGESAPMRQLHADAERAAAAEVPVLLAGETGTGKNVLARWLHAHSRRSQQALVELNCAGLSHELFENELFGHQQGAFTGAASRKAGLVEVADHGTLFLDEISDLDLQVQPKLLKILEDNTFRAVGDVRERRVDLRLISATQRELPLSIEQERFREDLYYRISVISLTIPPLRERRDDLAALAAEILARVAPRPERVTPVLSPAAEQRLREHDWPGNIRELRNVLQRAVLLAEGDLIEPQHLRFDSRTSSIASLAAAHLSLEEVEVRHIESVLSLERGHVGRAAEILRISRSSLYQRLRHGRIAAPAEAAPRGKDPY